MNDENAYNLIDEPWIPVLMRDGTNRSVSLGEVFADTGGTIADLALNPYERVAVFRLLLCIAQAALGPERLKDEAGWLAAKDAVGPVSTDYLKKWHDRFFLYGPHAFLQPDDVSAIRADAMTPCDKIVFRLASGANSTLYDHGAISSGRVLPDVTLALGLITYQNFSAAGLSGKCVWSGIETEKSIKGAPCREQSMLFTILCGGSLVESIWLNLVTAEQVSHGLSAEWGSPAWELASLSRSGSVELPKTFLGHLSPLSRAIKLVKGSASCILGGGQTYPTLPAWREQMASIKLKDNGEPTYISADPARMPWRELSSILSIHEAQGRKSALALRHIEQIADLAVFTIWTGGLNWESGQAKLIDTVEWSATLQTALLEDSQLQKYEAAIVQAERQRAQLRFATRVYAELMKVEESSRFYRSAERFYWDILAQSDNQKLVLDVNSSTYKDDWRNAIRKAAEDAYRRDCPAMTARQMEAFAQGFSKLTIREERTNE